MKQQFIQRNNTPNLTLFFAGWGVNERILENFPLANNDVLLCYDYRDAEFDYRLLQPYKNIRLTAWSLGVWMAARVLHQADVCFSAKIAFNGTMHPIDDAKGIAQAVYQGTHDNLTESSLVKFNKRMCGSNDFFKEFQEKNLQRSVEALKEELNSIKMMYEQAPEVDFEWTKAIVGTNDRIFLPENQLLSWENKTMIETKDVFHYDKNTLKELINKY